MSLFDFNVALGRSARLSGGAFETAGQLLAEMRRLRIGAALVYHNLAAEGDVQRGNQLLLEQLRGCGNLYPSWVMAPQALGDLPAPAAWVRDAVKSGVRAARLFPNHSLYTLAEWCLGPLLAELEQAELPVLMDLGLHHWSERRIPWGDIKTLCERYPRLPVVALDATVGDTRDLASLLPLVPNLHIEYHTFGLPDALGLFAEAGLSERLIFGTGMPLRAGECVVEQTLRSGLKAADQHAVSGANARRLLGIVEPESPSLLDLDPVVRARGLVVDVHAHVGSWERTSTSVKGPRDIVNSMHRCGVDKMVFSSFSAILGEMRLGNQETAQATRCFPGHLCGYCAINPNYPDETDEELARCFDQAENFVGLKFHCQLHGAPLASPGYAQALAFANERGLPVLVHGAGGDKWTEVAERYPGAAIIMAHGCAWDGRDPAGRELYGPVRDVANLYVDVAGSSAYRGALRALVDLVGVRKVLYGSDFPMFDLAFEVGRISLSDLNQVEKVAIKGGNALRIFKLLKLEEDLSNEL